MTFSAKIAKETDVMNAVACTNAWVAGSSRIAAGWSSRILRHAARPRYPSIG